MTATTTPDLGLREDHARPISDSVTMAWRNLLNIRRNPQLLVFATIQPVVFVLMFRYVFGGAIAATWNGVPVPYVDFLMPGIFVQTVTFGALTTGVGLAEDLHKGLIERFRSLPIARSAVLLGRTWADLVRNVFVVLLMAAVGYLVDWRIATNVTGLIAGLLIVLAFAYSLSWLFAIVGLISPDAETAQAASFPILAPLVFASSAFVPVDTMPGWLQAFANHQPVSAVCNAVRALTLGGPTQEYVIKALAWIIGIVVVCAPLAVRKYRQAT
jgi:ABC transporter DrrB family efflux protein